MTQKVRYIGLLLFINLAFWVGLASMSSAISPSEATFANYAKGSGPNYSNQIYHLLDDQGTFDQSNAVAFAVSEEGLFADFRMEAQVRVTEGGDGGSFLFLNTAEYAQRGPAPFVKNWTVPNLAQSFAVGIDVHNPPSDDPFDEWGNYLDMPQREISLHWDGREIVKRLSPVEFRGTFTEFVITVSHLTGGAEVSITVDGVKIFDRYFIAGMSPYETRLAIGAGTRDEIATVFDVKNLRFSKSKPIEPFSAPKHFTIFNHAIIDSNSAQVAKELTLPPETWAYSRIIITLDIHDAGMEWDPWDRWGALSVSVPNGKKMDILPFITTFKKTGRWQADVTHFRPWLSGPTSFWMSVATDRNQEYEFMVSASIDFYPGVPDTVPYLIKPLWNGTVRYGSDEQPFGDFFRPQQVSIDAQTEMVKFYMTTSGHSPIGEFTPSMRSLILVPRRDSSTIETGYRFQNRLWKTDNYLNPIRPQFGSWKYARAGWAPGDLVRPWWIDLTNHLQPGSTAEIRYEAEPYDFSDRVDEQRPVADQVQQAVHRVSSYLIFYKRPTDLVQAPNLEVLEVLPDSNAMAAGIQSGDYVLSYNGVRVDTMEGLRQKIKAVQSTDKQRAVVTIYRGPDRMDIPIETGKMGVRLME